MAICGHVKGLSREFGLCYSCGGKIEPSSTVCPQCNRLQLPPLNPNALLGSGDAESPPGEVAMTGTVATAAPAMPPIKKAPKPPAAPEEPTNHDIVLPALTDLPGQPALATASAGYNGTAAEVAAVAGAGEPAAADSATEPSAPSMQSMSLATVAMPAISEPLAGRSRRSAARQGQRADGQR